jgi:uncharacterized protein (DUF1810 family)
LDYHQLTMTTAAKLAEFVAAQDAVYAEVIDELTHGRKRTHWIWFIFPQMSGLGSSPTARKFGIASASEAQSYLKHGVLGPRLRECTRLMLAIGHGNIAAVMDYPDDLKFHSSMTLFATAASEEPMFEGALQQFFGGKRDPRTLELLRPSQGS